MSTLLLLGSFIREKLLPPIVSKGTLFSANSCFRQACNPEATAEPSRAFTGSEATATSEDGHFLKLKGSRTSKASFW